jgi:hypothetical protein
VPRDVWVLIAAGLIVLAVVLAIVLFSGAR